jgi:pimeloyl-ACP methyl ester carboxylesterase
MANAQVPWGLSALNGVVSKPSWRSKKSWYLVATTDKMIPPPAQHFMAQRAGATIVEAPGSHAIYVSKPEAVAGLIEQAASAETAAASH